MSDTEAPPSTEPSASDGLFANATSNPEGPQVGDTTEASVPLNGETSNLEGGASTESELKDTHMTDVSPSDQPQTSSILPGVGAASATQNSSNAPSPTPAPPPRVSTPSRITSNPATAATNPNGSGVVEGERTSSRAASVNPESGPSFTMPSEAPPHGAPVRQYINGKITVALLEGMKMVAKEQPKDPLRVLGEFLLQKSKELEGTTTS